MQCFFSFPTRVRPAKCKNWHDNKHIDEHVEAGDSGVTYLNYNHCSINLLSDEWAKLCSLQAMYDAYPHPPKLFVGAGPDRESGLPTGATP